MLFVATIGISTGLPDWVMWLGWAVALILAIRPLYEWYRALHLQARMSAKHLLDSVRLEEELERIRQELADCHEAKAFLERYTRLTQNPDADLEILVNLICRSFDVDELKLLCRLKLDIGVEDLIRGSLKDMAWDIVTWHHRRGAVRKLVEVFQEARPHFDWADSINSAE